jgi:hypothetical protein
MTRKTLLIGALAIAAITTSLQAKIGDTYDALIKTYGKPFYTQQVNNIGSSACWYNRGWGVVAIMDTSGIAQCMVYIKVKGTTVTKVEAAKLDNANITVRVPNWTKIPQDPAPTYSGGMGWISEGDNFFEVFDGNYLLDVQTNTWRPCRGYATQDGFRMLMQAEQQEPNMNDHPPKDDGMPADVQKIPV